MSAYIKPTDVHAPKRFWSLIHVLFDGGEATEENPSPNSLAIGRWNNDPVLAMRWNGNKENPLGNPQSRGLATWFIVPEQHWKQILETEQYKLSDDKVSFARNFLEFKRVYFLSHCPNPACQNYRGLVLSSFRTNELEATIRHLEQDKLKLYHIICDWSWKPSSNEKAELALVLKAAWTNYRSGRARQ
jgi:hypothetical protein